MPQDLLSQFDRKYALPIETYRQVANLTLRNAIPNGIRWEGMMCYVVSEGKSYVLTGGLTDSDWVEFGTLVNVNVVDNLASTSATDALSANQGRVLDETKLSDAPSDGDIYGRKDGAWEVVSGGGGTAAWGSITGTLSDQTDLQSALDGKVPTSRTLTAGNGLTGGGDLSANRTFTLGTPGSTTLSSTNAVTASSHTHAFAPGGTTAQYLRGDGSLATYAGGVTSVFGRTGAVTAQTGDYTFAQIGSKPTTISGYGITDFNSLGDARWLGISAKAADSDLLDGTNSTGFVNTTQTGQVISSGKYIDPGVLSASSIAERITIGKTTDGSFISIGNKAGGGFSAIFRGYSTSGVQLALNDGGINANGDITATSFKTTNWEIVETGGVLQFKYGGVTKFEMNSSGIMEGTDFKLGL